VVQWKFDNGSKKKIRGLRRRYKTFVNDLTDLTKTMPIPNDYGLGYWHLHLPFSQECIDSKNTPNKFRRDIMQKLIVRVEHLINIKTKEQSDYCIYAIISLPNLFDSQILVIPDKSWFGGFFERNSAEQKWIPLDSERNLIKEWNLVLSSDLKVQGFKEIISDDEFNYEGEIWFIGELN
jgi:hypothetical protein